MRIFLLAGKSKTGKDEIASLIKEYYNQKGKNTVITKFSKYIKLFAMEMLNWDGSENKKPRKFLQDLGETMRATKERIFINRMEEDIAVYSKYYENIVISDVRLIKEIEVLKKELSNVISIHVISTKVNNSLNEEERNHITETELDTYNNFDYTINNNYDNKLKEDVYKILEGVN